MWKSKYSFHPVMSVLSVDRKSAGAFEGGDECIES